MNYKCKGCGKVFHGLTGHDLKCSHCGAPLAPDFHAQSPPAKDGAPASHGPAGKPVHRRHPAPAAVAEAPKGGSRRPILIAIGVIVLLALAAGGARLGGLI